MTILYEACAGTQSWKMQKMYSQKHRRELIYSEKNEKETVGVKWVKDGGRSISIQACLLWEA